MQVTLQVLQGKSAGKEVPIDSELFLIGRGEDCDLRPKSDAISRRHCEIKIEGERVVVRDLGSRNGTYVNDERIEGPREVNSGDRLRLGRLEFSVVCTGAAVIPAALPSAATAGSSPAIAEAVLARAAKATRMRDDSSFDDTDISDWLEQGDESERARRLAEPDTRQFRLDETMHSAPPVVEASEESVSHTEESTSDSKADHKKKQQPGKLPPRPPVKSDSSKSAAEDMLRRFFNRR